MRSMRTRTWRRAVRAAIVPLAGAVALSGATFLGVGVLSTNADATQPAPSSAGPSRVGLPERFSSWGQLFATQRPLADDAKRLTDYAVVHPGSGFANVEVDAVKNSITVYWHGHPTAPEASMINKMRVRGVQVSLQPAKYSKSQLDAKMAQIRQDAKASATGERVMYIVPQPDGSGISVGVGRDSTGHAASVGIDQQSSGGLGKSLPRLQREVAAGGVTVNAQAPIDTAFDGTRETDTPWFRGGSLVTDYSHWCSTAFSVHWPTNNADYMTTAGHCAGVGSTWYNSNGGTIGVGTPGKYPNDMEFIQTAGIAAPDIYDGPGNFQSGQFQATVKDSAHSYNGEWVCMDGALTGEACSVQVYNTAGQDCTAGPQYCFNLVFAKSSIGQDVVKHGDSGGAVFQPYNDDGRSTNVIALGVIHGFAVNTRTGPISSLHNCPNGLYPNLSTDPAWTGCSDMISYTDIVTAMAPWPGMYVKTG